MAILNEKPFAETLPTSSAASVLLNGRYLPPPEDKDGKVWARSSALVQGDPLDLYALWRDLEYIPEWQEQMESVVVTGPTTSRWTMKVDDKTTSWDSEILADEPGKRIAWKSTSGEPQNAGEVIFEPAPGDRGTYVTVLQEFHIGKLASIFGAVVNRSPKQTVIENLRHFKALAETGEIPRTQNDPHAERGFIGNRKRSLYGEKIPTPPGEEPTA
jgi:uncharacterized membrane protein